jgi:hypothetical protein
MVQVNDASDLTPGNQPLLVLVQAKNGMNVSSTLRDFLNDPTNYIDSSKTSEVFSELEKITQGTNTGWRLLGSDPINFGTIGNDAIDISIGDTSASGISYGATGDKSIAAGFQSQAQNINSVSIGLGTIANKDTMIALGRFNKADLINAQFEVGIGTSDAIRRTGLVVFTDGTSSLPEVNNILINTRGPKAITTKEYVDASDNLKLNKAGDIMTGDLTVQGNIIQGGDNVATIDPGTGKIYNNQIPSIAITDVYVVNTIIERDALVVQKGDVAKVTDSGNGAPQTYIYDGTIWIDIQETSNVISVNGSSGNIILTTSDITEGGNLYYTDTRADARVQAAIDDLGAPSINSLFSSQKTAAIAIELDDTQLGAGLNPDGSYATPVGTNYIDTSTNFATADTLLDTQIKANADALLNTLGIADALTSVTGTNKLITETDLATSITNYNSSWLAIYDTTNNGIVDNAELINGLTVETAVPIGALFTDTVYNDTVLSGRVTTLENATPLGGATAGRPVDPALYTQYFDSTLTKPIWCSVNTTGANVWVDATGTIV